MMRYLLHHPTAAGITALIGIPGVYAVTTFAADVLSALDTVRF